MKLITELSDDCNSLCKIHEKRFLVCCTPNSNNPKGIRMICRTVSNDKFPAVYEEGCPYGENPEAFVSYLAETAQVVSEGDIKLPDTVLLNGAERLRMAAENPVAFVAENKMILNNIMGILIGVPPDCPEFYSRYQSKSERKTRYYKSRKGLFGHTLSLFGITKDHAHGHLHSTKHKFHILHYSILSSTTTSRLQDSTGTVWVRTPSGI